MTKISAIEEQVFTVGASPEKAYAFFAQLEQFRKVMTGVERCEVLPEGRVRWVLEEKVDKGIRFQADYIVSYEGNGTDHVRCRSHAGNMGNDWDVWIKPMPEGTQIHYRESVAPQLPITALTALLIKPLVARELRKEVNSFLDRVREVLAN